MRKILPIFAAVVFFGLLPGPPAASEHPPAAPAGKPAAEAAVEPAGQEPPRDYGRQFAEAQSAAAKLKIGRAWLGDLDREGQGQSAEALKLITALLELDPRDPQWLWRQAEGARLEGKDETALALYRRLIEADPGHPLAVRALRAVGGVAFKTGQFAQSAEADEKLLAGRLADPLPVLTRLAASYARLGRMDEVKKVLERARHTAPEETRSDPHLNWLTAELTEKEGNRAAAAKAMLDFANLFPRDKRAVEALLRAARARGDDGLLQSALAISGQAVEKAGDSGLRAAGMMIRGELLDKLENREEALLAYKEALGGAQDPVQVGAALRRVVDITIQTEGTAAALEVLAQQARRPNPVVAAVARSHFLALIKIEGERPGVAPADAAVMVELARRIGIDQPPPLLQLGAARLQEQVGDYALAAGAYGKLAAFPGEWGKEARLGLARSRPETAPPGLEADHPERLGALKREEKWAAIEEILPAENLAGKEAETKRILAARAAFQRNDPGRVLELLGRADLHQGEGILLRADARTVTGEWKAACADYRQADGLIAGGPEREWLEVRLAECEARGGKASAARKRLRDLLAGSPADPAALAAEQLQLRLGALARRNPS